MIIKSFIKDYSGLRPVEVEVECIQGLQQITILGLPDKIIQESAKKIQSALLNQGYHMPRGQQILVSLSPRDIKKSSLGLELAIALGILWISGQKPLPPGASLDSLYVYGELSLAGVVSVPEDIEDIPLENILLVTGESKNLLPIATYSLQQLQSEYLFLEEQDLTQQKKWIRSKCATSFFPKELARLLQIVAVGEHHILLAGSAGTGKTTFAEAIVHFLKEPNLKISREYRRIGRYFGDVWEWKPVVQPHHTSTPIAMIGGGVPMRPGEISRAHGGVLILDELLEFHQDVQSALREPMEQSCVRVSRSQDRRILPAKTLIVGTTNLCRCGEFTPVRMKACRCSSQNLRRYLERLSGPFIDRFALLQVCSGKTKAEKSTLVSSDEILQSCLAAYEFIDQRRGQKVSNQLLKESEIVPLFSKPEWLDLLPEFSSQRRRLALLRVAKTLADLDGSMQIELRHLRESEKLTVTSFSQMRSLF